MSKPTTTHRPTKTELLEAMQLLYGDIADWSDVRVYVPDGDGGQTAVNNPTIEFRGELNPQVPQETDSTAEYEEARQQIQQQQSEGNEQ